MPFLILIAVVVIIILVARSKRPEARGERGENKVRREVGESVENEQYVINDLIVENDGKTSQIDHVVINRQGVFVIETKNYSGRIYGDENQREWTQVLAKGRVKNKLYNPIRQNATHVYCVRKILPQRIPVYSLVVFVQNNTQYVTASNVIPLSDLKRRLNAGVGFLTAKEMKEAYDALAASKLEISTKEHVQNVKAMQEDLKRGICPRCGGRLVLRQGKYGEFWGCSNYPKCKFKTKD